ncbi:MAG: hypothetical protein RR733_02355 [Victivallaceae bacterium]
MSISNVIPVSAPVQQSSSNSCNDVKTWFKTNRVSLMTIAGVLLTALGAIVICLAATGICPPALIAVGIVLVVLGLCLLLFTISLTKVKKQLEGEGESDFLRIRQERDELIQERDTLQQEREALIQERDALRKVQTFLQQECDALVRRVAWL